MRASRVARLLAAACVAVCAAAMPVAAQTAADRAEWPKTDFTRITVPFDEIQSGGPPKDGIPAIDRPKFVAIREASTWLAAHEPVVALTVGTETRAYPLQILTWHEIVNDTVGGKPVAVTFCPLCNASIVFERTVAGGVVDFGTTGRLRKSDLVMYDRQSQTWWQQFTGVGIVGRHAGTRLAMLPSMVVSWSEFAKSWPQGRALSRDTGFHRAYGRNPYAGYDRIDQHPFLFTGRTDARLPPMERVLAVSAGQATRLHALSDLEHSPLLESALGGVPYLIVAIDRVASALDTEAIVDGRRIPVAAAFDRRLDGRTLTFTRANGQVRDAETGSMWNQSGVSTGGPLAGRRLAQMDGGVHFAFAWLAFHPQSEVHRPASTRPEAQPGIVAPPSSPR